MTIATKATIAGLLAIAIPLNAQFLPAQIVYDPTTCAKIIAEAKTVLNTYNKVALTYDNALKMYQTMTNAYNFAKYQATALTNMHRFSITSLPWLPVFGNNNYGNSGGWYGAMNHDINVAGAWAQASMRTFPLPHNPSPIQLAHYSTLELSDAAAINAMQNIGTIRNFGPQNDIGLNGIQANIESDDIDDHTQTKELNQLNSTGQQQARLLNSQNQLLATMAEMQVVQMKTARDAQAASLSFEQDFRGQANGFLQQVHGNPDAEINAFHLN